MNKTRIIITMILAVTLSAILSCSSHKNTAKNRFWQSFTAKYNIYYNGTLAYIEGSQAKEDGNKDNYTEIIPLYTVGNKNSVSLGSGSFDKAIEKSQKAIKLHSINKRPEWTKSRRKTEKDIEWLSRREYNPMMWKAWMLMGRSQFHKGAFDEAAATFNYMGRLYQTQPAIYGKARAWLAKCYIEQEWLYDAEDIIRNMKRDSLDWRAVKEWDYTYADYYIHAGEYEQAIPYLRKVIKHEMRRKQRAREWFLLGQLEAELGNRDKAYKAYKKVLSQNPPYELAFNARIAMTEVMAANSTKKTISRLKRMAASDNNKDYLDQVYYAMGNVYMLEKDTTKAIEAYEKGNTKSTRNGVEKGVLLLKLGNLYWEKEKFGDAQRCYGAAIGMLDKERKDYEELSHRSKILDELAPYTEAIHLQDSLLELADMPEKERNEAIDRVIEALKKKEKEEKKAQQEQAVQQAQSRGNTNMNNRNQRQTNQPMQGQQQGEWYFYNSLAVTQGKSTFQRQWGKRENEDNWQRSNKTVVGDFSTGEDLAEMADSVIAAQEAAQDSLATVQDSAQNDPHKREYYLAQIPFSEEQKAECHAIISDGLFHSGVIFKDKFDNLRLSEKQFNRLTANYPDFEKMDETYYHLFLLHSRKGNHAMADTCVQRLKEGYPESQWTKILTDPYFVENSKWGEQMEDSLYSATYNAFKADRYEEVYANTTISETRFPLGNNRDKFVFIRGLSRLNDNNPDGCLEDMNYVVKNHPTGRISEMAGMIVNGVKSGKVLRGGRFDLSDVWSRRSAVLNDSDSIAARKFTPDRDKEFLFILAYAPDSVNENQLLFELARFNFTTYIVRNFDIQIEDKDGIHLMEVSGFRFFDEAHQYASEVHRQENIMRRMGKARTIIISRDNLDLLGKQFSYDDYTLFYEKNFAPLIVRKDDLLSEPAEIGFEKEPELKGREGDNGEPSNNGNQEILDASDGFDIPSNDNGTKAEDDGGLSITEDNEGAKPQTNDDGGMTIPTDDNGGMTVPTDDDGGMTIPTDDNGGMTVPTDDDGGMTIPTDDNGGMTVPTDDDGGMTIPTDDDGGMTVPTDDTNITIPNSGVNVIPDTPTPPTNDDEYQLDLERPKNNNNKRIDLVPGIKDSEKTKQEQVELPSKSTQPQQQAKAEKEKKKAKTPTSSKQIEQTKAIINQVEPLPQKEDTGIVFDDGFGEDFVPETPKKKKEKELEEIDLEDEYYDLDGF